VAITDAFMDALAKNTDYDLIDPHTQQVVAHKPARAVMDRIVNAAWATGDPGLVFIDRANASPANPTPELEPLEATNPCGEQWLGPFDACNLGSINLGLFVSEDKHIDWDALGETVQQCVRFLDDVIDVNPYPLKEIRDKVHANRRIGLGVMGWADMLFKLGIRYDSDEAVQLGERVMRFVSDESDKASLALAKERDVFPNWSHSIYKDGLRLRNSNRTTVAPTGTISIIADCSSGIEPIFALAFQHRVKQPDGSYRVLDFVNPVFLELLEAANVENKDEIIAYVKEHGSLHGHPAQSNPALAAFVTAHEIAPDWHIRMQAAFQKGVNSSISKTINLPNHATTEDVEAAYMLAWQLGCLGITVFRDGSKGEQVLNVGVKQDEQPAVTTAAPAVVEAAPVPAPKPAPRRDYTRGVKDRPDVVHGYTRQIRSPEGKVSVTLNSDNDGLLEVFVTIGKAGSDVAALAEALGRLISLQLRIESPLSQNERARDIADQLRSIGGSSSIGFGQDRVRSLPDAVARAILLHLNSAEHTESGDATPAQNDTGAGYSNGGGGAPATFREAQQYTVIGNLCPQCGCNTLVYAEGCKKCLACGHSEC
ncbi:MAG TPA: adenosylcobalamin-dependent ribonucleoside-diphosphate reductase, partial [Ktedonobacterales bacterium]|nr:adenosylcobalamin-dependent ribonucleoside-diphosphate reductase [Ktedonobacterales bacterium]